jgi:hypothetical protein
VLKAVTWPTAQRYIANGIKGHNLVQETIVVKPYNSTQAKTGGIIVSATETSIDRATLVVGRPGFPNIERTLSTGGVVLFETSDGLFEVRVMSTWGGQVTILLSQISPRPGIMGGFVDQESDNAPFSPPELVKIATSLAQIRQAISGRPDVLPEQLDFISRKLDYLREASERLGRKDWIGLAIGTIGSAILTIALTPEVQKTILQAADIALSWLFTGGMRLLLP